MSKDKKSKEKLIPNAQDALAATRENDRTRTSKAVEALYAECEEAIEGMIAQGEYSVGVLISGDDALALDEVIDRLRVLGYKFRLVTTVDKTASVKEQDELIISIEHLR
jgi:hypothetical protein